MWKKAFIVLLSLNLFVIVGGALWWGTLPKASSVTPPSQAITSNAKAATIQLSVGQDAVNTYLEYALSQQQDVRRVLSYANVQFSNTWKVQLGLKLQNRIVPCNLVFVPQVNNGNLVLHVQSATMGEIPAPLGALFFILRHLPWPQWITVDGLAHNLNINFTERPQNPYGVKILSYSPSTKQVTLLLSIIPKSIP